MIHTSTEQPEALRLADWCDHEYDRFGRMSACATELRHLHTRVQELEAENEHLKDAAWTAIDALEASQAQRVPLSEPITHVAYRPTWDGETWTMTQIVPMNSIKVDQLKTHWVTHRDFSDDPFTSGLRYAERAHGITQENM